MREARSANCNCFCDPAVSGPASMNSRGFKRETIILIVAAVGNVDRRHRRPPFETEFSVALRLDKTRELGWIVSGIVRRRSRPSHTYW